MDKPALSSRPGHAVSAPRGGAGRGGSVSWRQAGRLVALLAYTPRRTTTAGALCGAARRCAQAKQDPNPIMRCISMLLRPETLLAVGSQWQWRPSQGVFHCCVIVSSSAARRGGARQSHPTHKASPARWSLLGTGWFEFVGTPKAKAAGPTELVSEIFPLRLTAMHMCG